MHVEIIDTNEAFAQLREQWDRVYAADPQADYFLSARWLAEVLPANPGRWAILTARESEGSSEYAGFLPLMVSTRWSRSRSELQTELKAAGRLSWAQYTGFVCRPELEDAVIGALSAAVRQLPWAYFTLKKCSASAGRLDAFLKGFDAADYEVTWGQSLMNKGTVDNLVCPSVKLPPDYESWLASLSANTRQKIRRFSRRLDESNELRISITPRDEFNARLEQMLELWLRKWEPVRGADRARNVAAKYVEILSQSNACDTMFLPVLWQAETMLGALAIIVDRDKRHMYFIAAGRDEQSSDPAIGLMLHAFSIRWAIENQFAVYDLCHGNEAYKYSLGPAERRLRDLQIRRRSHTPPGRYDVRYVSQALDQVVHLIQVGRVDDAVAACKQLRRLHK